jgi:hypothetical protein
MRKIVVLLISMLVAGPYLPVQAATLLTQFISTSAVNNSSTFTETVTGCTTTSVNVVTLGYNTVANLYDDGSFVLGYDANRDNDLNDVGSDIVLLTGIWSNIDAALTQFSFQPDGNLAIGNGTLGWQQIYNWTKSMGCVGVQTNGNTYNLTYPATFRVLKSGMTLTPSSNPEAGTLSFTVQGYGQTKTSLTTPPATAPQMQFVMQVKGFWY